MLSELRSVKTQCNSITQQELNTLLNIPALTFDLPFKDKTQIYFDKVIKQ